jgi:hypothetical protein
LEEDYLARLMSSEEKENVPAHERSMIFGDLIDAWKKAQHRES